MNKDQREAYKQKADAELDVMQAKLTEMKARAESASADAKIELLSKADEVSKSYEAAKQRLAAMADAGDDAWDEAKMRFEGFRDAVKEKVGDLSS